MAKAMQRGKKANVIVAISGLMSSSPVTNMGIVVNIIRGRIPRYPTPSHLTWLFSTEFLQVNQECAVTPRLSRIIRQSSRRYRFGLRVKRTMNPAAYPIKGSHGTRVRITLFLGTSRAICSICIVTQGLTDTVFNKDIRISKCGSMESLGKAIATIVINETT